MNAGWYSDPTTPGILRYFDGTQWTTHTSPVPVDPGTVAVPTQFSSLPAMPGQYTVAPKSPAVSLLVSFFIPGVGSMINGDVGIGVTILVGFIVSAILTLIVIGIFGVIGFWIWGMIDAYQGAQRWNRAHGIIS